jgi:uncharacterized protein (DUF433 family)
MTTTSLEFTPAEAAALADVSEPEVRKEIEYQVLPKATPPRLSFAALVYLQAKAQMGIELTVKDRKALFKRLEGALARRGRTPSVEVSDLLELRIGPLVAKLRDHLKRFQAWERRRVASDPAILGGEPIFKGTRLSVRHIGGMLERGESGKNIRSDYRELSPEDLAFSRLFVRAYPRVGRPPAAGETAVG